MSHVRMSEQTALTGRMVRGVVGGVAAGVVFAALVIWSVTSQDLEVRAPFLVISTIVLGDDALATGDAEEIIGLIVHFAISIFYGMAFGLITPRLGTNGTVALAGLAYGGLIYLIDYRVAAPLWFPIFETFDQSFALLVHLIYGVVVSTAFFSSDIRRGEPIVSFGMSGQLRR